MTIGNRNLRCIVALAVLMLAAAPDGGLAQQSDRSERNAPRAQARPQASSAAAAQTKPWSLDDALPDNSPAAQASRAKTAPAIQPTRLEPAKPELGRVPLRSGPGTFGLETETKVKSTEFPDGRRVPGVETTQHRPPSYFGLSISVPTNDKSIIPSIAPPFGRND
jgi:hypothetical protein